MIRLSLSTYDDGMEPDTDGEFVRYEDIAAMHTLVTDLACRGCFRGWEIRPDNCPCWSCAAVRALEAK